ncbi:hypothetical protein KFK14_03370 [Sphingobium phenoxybenzoativorans]|uniref:Uncharacterized protein n=1 Tax=Sphingobium phenoxybenzoativorans TaxID=1592790 RepID=A0A975KAP4_9SPHN|nr:hypothetical protein [Sphingobium phenoxybenzoativorans]QUT06517.1 hypothetical protein KFK14_03370 [Sphingobium phenoxybenzoativorans]
MDYLQDALFHVSQNIHRQLLLNPGQAAAPAQPISALIDRVEAMRRRREPGQGQGVLDLRTLRQAMAPSRDVQ